MPDITSRIPARLTLHLGVIDVPYNFAKPIKGFKTTKHLKARKPQNITTGDVAGFLEAKYHLMEKFYNVYESDVMDFIGSSLKNSMEALLMGHSVEPWGEATQAIDAKFRDFISSRKAETVGIPGTPTKAAQWAINHRLARPYAKNPRRPTFRDTGLYMASFRSWVD